MNCTMRLCLAGHAACAIGQRGSVRLIFFLCLLDGHAQGPQVPSIYNISMSIAHSVPSWKFSWFIAANLRFVTTQPAFFSFLGRPLKRLKLARFLLTRFQAISRGHALSIWCTIVDCSDLLTLCDFMNDSIILSIRLKLTHSTYGIHKIQTLICMILSLILIIFHLVIINRKY